MIISNKLTLGGTCSNNLDKTSGILSSSSVTNITALTLGGTLQLNITGDALVIGDSFKLFSFGTATGAFTAINPSVPGTGLAWDTSKLTVNGTLGVIVAPPSAPVIGSITLSGTSLVLNITNGVAGGTNYVLAATNLMTPILQWTPLATNIFDVNGSSLWTNTVSRHAATLLPHPVAAVIIQARPWSVRAVAASMPVDYRVHVGFGPLFNTDSFAAVPANAKGWETFAYDPAIITVFLKLIR